MKTNRNVTVPNGTLKCGAMMMIALQVFAGLPQSAYAQTAAAPATTTPIKHVIIIIGENRTFDHVYGTYTPKEGETVSNLLSKGIVKANGKPGPNYSLSAQFSALDNTASGGTFSNSPQSKSIYSTLPPALAGGPEAPTVAGPRSLHYAQSCKTRRHRPRQRLQPVPRYRRDRHCQWQAGHRITNANNLREGVFQLSGTKMPYDAYTASPVHRFFQMWQQTDCNVDYATKDNPSGCLNDLFPWVETTVGTGSNGQPLPSNFNDTTTGEGSAAMGFYNMAQGDAPYFKQLADDYTISDNFHQSVMGGTGANHIMFGFGDAIYYTNASGVAVAPPAGQAENPDPMPNTNNYYDQDGYSGGSYVNCGDISQPGVPAVTNYLQSLKRPVNPNCVKGNYYLVNNYNPGFNGDGTSTLALGSPFTIPPTSQKSIGDDLVAHNVPFKYFGEDWDLYVTDPTESNTFDEYCNICNPFQYQSQFMSTQAARETYIGDTTELYEDIDTGNLPPVSIVKPSGFNDGHPASSKLDLFEGFVKKIVNGVKSNPTLWADTAIFITEDEGGGYYDSGYIQPVDFFGDGTRIPLIVVSKYSKGGHVSHEYGDHVSLLKFIEKNWSLPPVSTRSRDNLPNPIQKEGNPYVPTNSPAIGDLTGDFKFPSK